MRSKVYVETTVISYLAASPSRDIVVAAHQQLTREGWERRERFDLVVSQAVVDEVSRGDTAVAARRLALLAQIPLLDLGHDVNEFARQLLPQPRLSREGESRCCPHCRRRRQSGGLFGHVELRPHRECRGPWQ